MKESYDEIPARNVGPESYAVEGNLEGVVTARVQPGAVSELRNHGLSECRHPRAGGRQHGHSRYGREDERFGGVEEPRHGWKPQTREPGDPVSLSEEVADSGPKTPPEVQRT